MDNEFRAFAKEVRDFMQAAGDRLTIIETTLRINAEEHAKKVSRRQYRWMIASIIVTATLGIGTFIRGFFS